MVGILADKDAAGIVTALAPLADRFILVAPPSPRATTPDTLRTLVPAAVRKNKRLSDRHVGGPLTTRRWSPSGHRRAAPWGTHGQRFDAERKIGSQVE